MNTGTIIGTVIGLVVGVIGLQIVNEVINDAGFTGLLETVTENIPVLFAVSLLILAVSWAYTQMR